MNFKKWLEVGMGSDPKIYISYIDGAFFKVENFPVLSESDKRDIIRTDKPFILKKKDNPKFWGMIRDIQEYTSEDPNNQPDIGFEGDFLSLGTAYISQEENNVYFITNELEVFGVDEDEEENWNESMRWEKI